MPLWPDPTGAEMFLLADYAGQTRYIRAEGHPANLLGTDKYADLPDHLRYQGPLEPYGCSTFYCDVGRSYTDYAAARKIIL